MSADLARTFLFLAIALVGAGVMGLAWVRARRTAPDIGRFMEGLELAPPADELSEPFITRMGGIVARGVARRAERWLPYHYLARINQQLAQAGLGAHRRAGEQVALQLGCAAAGALVTLLVLANRPPAGGLRFAVLWLPAIGWIVPSARLKRRIRARSDAMFKDLPDMIDMLAIAVEAGCGFESAMSLVCAHFHSPFADELTTALREMELGLPRRQALEQVKARTDLDVVRTFVLALVQADALGIPIGRVLKAQATEIRNRRRAWAREKAAKLPVTILFPLVLFIFPPLLAIVLAPAAESFLRLG